MKMFKIKKKMKRASYDVAMILEQDAYDLAQIKLPAFKFEKDGNFYTYEDVATDNNIPYVSSMITDVENDYMFIIEWNGTSPVFKKRKMYPR